MAYNKTLQSPRASEFSSLLLWLGLLIWWQIILLVLGKSAIALLSGYYFYLRLKGHTKDT